MGRPMAGISGVRRMDYLPGGFDKIFATLGSYFIMFVLIFIISQKIYKIEYEWTKLIKLLVIIILAFSFNFLYEMFSETRPIYLFLIKLSLFSFSLILVSQLKVISFKKINILFNRKI